MVIAVYIDCTLPAKTLHISKTFVRVCVCVIMCVKHMPVAPDSLRYRHVPSSAAACRPGIIGREEACDEKPFHSIEITLRKITL